MSDFQVDSELLDEILKPSRTKNLPVQERVLRKVIVQLVKSGHASFLLLSDDDTSKYWGKILSDAQKKVAARKEEWRKYEIKMGVWKRLSEEDRALIGIRMPIKPKI